MNKKPLQYSLSGLFAVLTLTALILAYMRVSGVQGFFLALIPPLFIGGCILSMLTPAATFDNESNKWIPNRTKPDAVRSLLCMIAGFAIWIPVLFLILFGNLE